MFAPKHNEFRFNFLEDPEKKKHCQDSLCTSSDDKKVYRDKEANLIARLHVTPIHEIPEVPEGKIIFKSKCYFEIVDKVFGRIILKPKEFEFNCFGGCFEKHFKVWIEGLDEDGVEAKLFEHWIDKDTQITTSEHNKRVVYLAKNTVTNLLITASIIFRSGEEFCKYTAFFNDGIRRANMLKNA